MEILILEDIVCSIWKHIANIKHPLDPDIKRQLYIDQSNISHIIDKVWWEGNLLKAQVTAANTARGADFDGLIKQGSEVAFSLRAVG